MGTVQAGVAAATAAVPADALPVGVQDPVERAAVKAKAAVEYHERALEAARVGVANGEAKVTKFRDLLAVVETGLTEAREAERAAERDLSAARARLAEMGG